jgi:hypothetical protein
MYDDWSIWEALKMAKLKGNELIVYSHFAKATATKLRLPHTAMRRTMLERHEIIKIVDRKHNGLGSSGLTQTQVRYAMKKLIMKNMIVIQDAGKRPEYYVSVCELKMDTVNSLVRRAAEISIKFGTLEESKIKMKARIEKTVRKLHKVRGAIDKCKTHLELAAFDQSPRDFISYRD